MIPPGCAAQDPPTHELVLRVAAERITQAAVPAGDAHAAADRIEQPLLLLRRELSHRERLHHKRQAFHLLRVEIRIQCVRHLHVESVVDEPRRKDVHTLLGLVAIPAAPYDECPLLWRLAPGPGYRTRPG